MWPSLSSALCARYLCCACVRIKIEIIISCFFYIGLNCVFSMHLLGLSFCRCHAFRHSISMLCFIIDRCSGSARAIGPVCVCVCMYVSAQ